MEAYELISEIEKRKFPFDKTTEMMLEKLAQGLPKVTKELKKKFHVHENKHKMSI